MEGVNVAFADNSTNWNVSTLHNEIEGVGVSSFLLDCMRSWLQPLAMEHHLPKKRIFIEIPDQYKPEQSIVSRPYKNQIIELPILICKWIYTIAGRGSPFSFIIPIRLNKDNIFDL